ncbi:MAG: M20/M25/M40 family metallo-hydrolase [bacterium]
MPGPLTGFDPLATLRVVTNTPFPADTADVAALTQWLMSYDSTSGSETALVDAFAAALAEREWRVRKIPAPSSRSNLLVTAGEGPYVTLSTHLDTVPRYLPPHRDGTKIFGRGACDAKGIAASMVCAAERLRRDGVSVAMLFVVGEETTHDGAHAAEEWLKRTGFVSRALINGEPTESTLAVGTKGAMRFIVRTVGEAAHSAYPQLGRSATHALVHLLADLDGVKLPSDELLGETTINIGKLSGGVADNVLAPAAEARLMVRLVTHGDAIWKLLTDWANGRAQLERSTEVPFVRLSTLPGFPTSVVAFATDIPAMPSWGTPYLYGPGSIHVAHRDDEFVEIAELETAVDAYERLVRRLSAE